MAKIYTVTHVYGQDGGFGDYVECSDLVCVCSTKEKAEEIVNKYAKPHIYDRPYDDLDCGRLNIEEIELDKLLYEEKFMWWLHNEVLEELKEEGSD